MQLHLLCRVHGWGLNFGSGSEVAGVVGCGGCFHVMCIEQLDITYVSYTQDKQNKIIKSEVAAAEAEARTNILFPTHPSFSFCPMHVAVDPNARFQEFKTMHVTRERNQNMHSFYCVSGSSGKFYTRKRSTTTTPCPLSHPRRGPIAETEEQRTGTSV